MMSFSKWCWTAQVVHLQRQVSAEMDEGRKGTTGSFQVEECKRGGNTGKVGWQALDGGDREVRVLGVQGMRQGESDG